MSFQDTFDSIIMIIFIVHLFTVDKKVSLNIEAIKVSQKRRKIIDLYKSVNINFCITFEILSKFQESSIEKFK